MCVSSYSYLLTELVDRFPQSCASPCSVSTGSTTSGSTRAMSAISRTMRGATVLLALAIDCGRAAPINKTHTRPVLSQRDHGRADPGYALDEGFHADPDGSAVTAGWHHTCALRFHEGADFGGRVECWGHDAGGETMPPPGSFLDRDATGALSCSHECWRRRLHTHTSPSSCVRPSTERAAT